MIALHVIGSVLDGAGIGDQEAVRMRYLGGQDKSGASFAHPDGRFPAAFAYGIAIELPVKSQLYLSISVACCPAAR